MLTADEWRDTIRRNTRIHAADAGATPETDAITKGLFDRWPDPIPDQKKLLYYMEATQLYGMECKKLERELAAIKQELAHIHEGMLCVAECPVIQPGDTITIQYVKELCTAYNLMDNELAVMRAAQEEAKRELPRLRRYKSVGQDGNTGFLTIEESPDGNIIHSDDAAPFIYAAIALLALKEAEIAALKVAFRVNMLRAYPAMLHEDIDKAIDAARAEECARMQCFR